MDCPFYGAGFWFLLEAQYASCHQSCSWVQQYVQDCSGHLASLTTFATCPIHNDVLEAIPLGLEDGHWQKVQLEKVMGCNLVSSFGVVAWRWFQWHLGEGLGFRGRCPQFGPGKLKDYGTQFAATTPEMSKALQVKTAPAEQGIQLQPDLALKRKELAERLSKA